MDGRRSDETRIEGEQSLSEMLESIADAVYALDGRWRFVYANRRSLELWRRSPGEVVGRAFLDVFPEAAGTEAFTAHHRAMAERRPQHVDTLSPVLGTPVDVHIYPRQKGGVVVVFRDVSDRRRAEAALHASEQRLRALVAAVPEIVWTADARGAIDFFNAQWYAYTGQSETASRNWGWASAIHPDDLDRCLARWMHSVETGADYEAEYRFRRRDGVYRWFLGRGRAVRDEDGAVANWFGTCTDIDDLRRAQQALNDLNATLEERIATAVTAHEETRAQLVQAQKMEAVGQLTGGVAHDFNNLLTAVLGHLELLVKHVADNPRAAKYVAQAQLAAERGARLTAQLLAFGRRQLLRPETVMANEAVEAMRPLIERAAGETIRLGITAEPGLWPCNVDRAQLEAAVLNLALNARDAMPDGGALAISVGNIGIGAGDAAALDLPPGQFVQLTVADTGSGMTAEVAARAFEPFYSTKEVGKGSGLGLSQVYGFSRQSGGTTLIESEPGAGTTVSLFLPRAPEVVAAAVAPPAAVSRTDARHSVLVVEDEPGVLALLEESLSDLGYRVLAARDAAAALAILRSDAAIDLLFSDIILPGGMTGIELARQARRLRQDLKVLLSSGYPGDKWAQHGSAGEFEVLGKPFRQSDLTARIGAILATERR